MVAGAGSLAEHLKQAAEELGVSDCVVWLGQVDDVQGLLESAHVYVNPSAFPQTWAISNLEAFSAGAAVVAFDRGGPGAYLEDEENCVVPKTHSPHGLADAMLRLLGDDELRRKTVEGGKKTVREGGFTMKEMVEKYARLYKGLKY